MENHNNIKENGDDRKKIPTVDLKDLYNIPFDRENSEIKAIAENFGQVLHDWGFAYITNHGIPQNLVLFSLNISIKTFHTFWT